MRFVLIDRIVELKSGKSLIAVKNLSLGEEYLADHFPGFPVMPGVLKDMRIDSRRAEVEIVKVWNSLIDPNIVAHAQPVGLRKGTLFVVVDSSVWLSEIVRYRRKEILDRLQHSFGRDVIVKISFRIG